MQPHRHIEYPALYKAGCFNIRQSPTAASGKTIGHRLFPTAHFPEIGRCNPLLMLEKRGELPGIHEFQGISNLRDIHIRVRQQLFGFQQPLCS